MSIRISLLKESYSIFKWFCWPKFESSFRNEELFLLWSELMFGDGLSFEILINCERYFCPAGFILNLGFLHLLTYLWYMWWVLVDKLSNVFNWHIGDISAIDWLLSVPKQLDNLKLLFFCILYHFTRFWF